MDEFDFKSNKFWIYYFVTSMKLANQNLVKINLKNVGIKPGLQFMGLRALKDADIKK